MNINWKKAVGFGVLLWVFMFVIISAFIAFNLYESAGMPIVTSFISAIIVFIFASKVEINKVGTALKYGASWVVIGLVLDLLITLQFNDQIFKSWPLWLSYGLVLIVPLLQVRKPLPPAAPSETGSGEGQN